MSDPAQEYVPGVCNIGPSEIRLRRWEGYLGIVLSLVILAELILTDSPVWWRILIALPAGFAASGFIQAKMHFCANFGYRGMYNFDKLGSAVRVKVEEALRKDRRKAWGIFFRSAAIGLAVALATMLIPLR